MKFNDLQKLTLAKKIISHIPIKLILLVFFILSAILYASFGWDITCRLTNKSPLAQAERYIQNQKKNNPVLADDIKRLQIEYGNAAVASKLKLDTKAIQKDLPVVPLKKQIESNHPLQELELVKLAQDTNLELNPEQLNKFISTYYQALRFIPNVDVRKRLLGKLAQASHDKDAWSIVSGGLSGLLAWEATRDKPSLWRFYKNNHSWITEPLMLRIFNENKILDNPIQKYKHINPVKRMENLLSTAQKYQNLLIKLSKQDSENNANLISMVMHIFESHGQAVKLAVDRYGLPLTEVLAVIYANPNTLKSHIQNTYNQASRAEAEASLLSQIYNKEPDIWRYARTTGLALRFYLDVPNFANKVLANYGDKSGFLVQLYESYNEKTQSKSDPLLSNAASAIATYEDLAVRTLYDYKDNYYFKNALKDPDIGKRIVPFVVRYPDRLQDAVENPGWIDKNFNEEGYFKDDNRWWEALPGGAIGKVFKNWANGYPCDWSELGWVTFDAVDVGLLVFTAGTSKIITSAAKISVKGAGRTTTAVLRGATRSGGKIKKLFRVFKGSSNKADDVASAATKSKKSSSLLGRVTSKIRYKTDNIAKKIGKSPSKRMNDIQYKKFVKRWRNIGIALALTKAYIKKDTLKKAPEQIGATLGNIARDAVIASGIFLGSFAKSFLVPDINRLAVSVSIHVLVVILLLSIAFVISRKMKHKTVNQI